MKNIKYKLLWLVVAPFIIVSSLLSPAALRFWFFALLAAAVFTTLFDKL